MSQIRNTRRHHHHHHHQLVAVAVAVPVSKSFETTIVKELKTSILFRIRVEVIISYAQVRSNFA